MYKMVALGVLVLATEVCRLVEGLELELVTTACT